MPALPPVSGHRQVVSACPKSADTVGKSFFGVTNKKVFSQLDGAEMWLAPAA
jgi:hypothetical protein